MNKNEMAARIRVLETAVDILVRLLPDAQRREWQNSLESQNESDEENRFLAHHWAADLDPSRSTAEDGAKSLLDWIEQKRRLFGPDD